MRTKNQIFTPKKRVRLIILVLLLFVPWILSYGQKETFSLTFNLTVSDELQSEFRSQGRLFLFFDRNSSREPRTNSVLGGKWCLFGKNYSDWKAQENIAITSSENWDIFQPNYFLITDHPEKGWFIHNEWGFENVPEGIYYVQFLWDQNTKESKINSSGNFYSKPQKIEVNRSMNIEMTLTEVIPPLKLIDHELIKEVHIQSDTLSNWWGKPVFLKASVLLPNKYYENPGMAYPILYDIAGYGGRYTRINSYMEDDDWAKWWISDEAPQLINVFLDGEGPYGDCYQIDSEMGPYGYALIHELIPYIETKYRGTQSPESRFVSGCSTGGWSSLALQLFYPESFNGVFSYGPDPVDFSNFWLIDIYNDKNIFINNLGYPQPLWRSVNGKMMLSWKDYISWERVLSPTNSYLGSRFFVAAYMALYSPRGKDGIPMSLFNEETGKIDHEVAENWKKYDLLLYTKENWKVLGPKLKGKIYIWMGDMDECYLNPAVRSYEEFLRSTENPKSDAVIEYTPMSGHCWEATQYNQIMKAAERLTKLDKE